MYVGSHVNVHDLLAANELADNPTTMHATSITLAGFINHA
jgi:hypothetical protein